MRLPRRRLLSLALGALALLFAPDCTREGAALPGTGGGAAGNGGGGAGGEAGAPEGVLLWGADWTLRWDLARVDLHPGGGWSVKTDLGYQVTLGAGWIVDHSVSFGPCVVPPDDAGASWIPFHLGVREARAHDSSDPSGIELSFADDLAHPADSGPWQSVFAPTRYCRAHWLVARATSALDAPPGVDLGGSSMQISGSWSRADESGPVAVDTWWPHGHLDDLAPLIDPAELAAARADGVSRVARVTVERPLGGMFDGIDFAAASNDQVAGLVLDNLAAQARLKVSLFDPAAP
jgi:hypothetical protein